MVGGGRDRVATSPGGCVTRPEGVNDRQAGLLRDAVGDFAPRNAGVGAGRREQPDGEDVARRHARLRRDGAGGVGGGLGDVAGEVRGRRERDADGLLDPRRHVQPDAGGADQCGVRALQPGPDRQADEGSLHGEAHIAAGLPAVR